MNMAPNSVVSARTKIHQEYGICRERQHDERTIVGEKAGVSMAQASTDEGRRR
jgi:hypothetical protein